MIKEIYVNGRFLENELTGVGEYSLNMLREMDVLLATDEFQDVSMTLLHPNKIKENITFDNIKVVRLGRVARYIWEQLYLPWKIKNKYLLNLHSVAPILKNKQIVVLHDAKMADKKASDSYTLQRYFLWLLGIVLGKRLRKIITVSEFSKKQLNQKYKIPKEKIEVISQGCEHILKYCEDNTIFQRNGISKQCYVLAVGGGSAKNNIYTARAIEKYNYGKKEKIHMILVGSIPEVVRSELKCFSNVNLVGRVTYEELVSLYKNAICLAFPSISEGFGMPPIEAMTLGCPVIASTVDSIPEVCSDGALYCDISRIDSFNEKLEMLLKNSELRQMQIEKGYKNIKRFSWKDNAKKLLIEVIRDYEKCNSNSNC